MPNKENRKKGNYYLKKSLDLLKEQGYQVMRMETNKVTFIKGRALLFHYDNFASDILAMSDKEIIFIQVKFQTEGKFTNINQWKDAFNKFKWPPFVKKQLWLWEPRKKVRVVEV